MILTSSRNLCLPTRATVQEIFSVARDADVLPDLSLDPVLATFLSLDSCESLRHQHERLQRSMSSQQQSNFSRTLTRELGARRVTYGGVGVVALALSLLFDQVSQQVTGTPDRKLRPKKIFGIMGSSRIGRIIVNYLQVIPTMVNDVDRMAETTELFDSLLKLEMLDHYERMTMKKRMGTVALQQWLTGAAVHLHMRIHQVRMHSVPVGSAEALRLSYRTGFGNLVQRYTSYLRRTLRESPAQRPSHFESSESLNKSRVSVVDGSFRTGGTTWVSDQSGPNPLLENRIMGAVTVEPGRNVSHMVHHRQCESPIIEQALVTRIINAQDLDFFLDQETIFKGLLRQSDHFELKVN